MRPVLAVVAAFSLTACASYESIRELHPDRVASYRAERVALGSCVLDQARRRWDASSDLLWVDNPADRESRVVARHRTLIGSSTNMVQWDLTLRSEPDGATLTELRADSDLWGRPMYPRDLPSVIEQCSAKAA